MGGNLNITKEEYAKVVKSELSAILREKYGESILEEGFWDSLKGGGKKIAKAYIDIFKAYGEVLEDLFGLKPEDSKAPDVPTPEEVAQDLKSGDEKEVAQAVDDMEAQLSQMKSQAATKDPVAAKKVDNVLQKVATVEDEIEGGDEKGKHPESDDLLNLLDNIIDEWDAVEGKTKDDNLKKAMAYIEKVALAELRKISNRRKNNG